MEKPRFFSKKRISVESPKGAIGQVAGVMETAQHPILEVEFEDKLILIPWVKEIVKEIDDKAKTIKVESPDGLIDLYINA